MTTTTPAAAAMLGTFATTVSPTTPVIAAKTSDLRRPDHSRRSPRSLRICDPRRGRRTSSRPQAPVIPDTRPRRRRRRGIRRHDERDRAGPRARRGVPALLGWRRQDWDGRGLCSRRRKDSATTRSSNGSPCSAKGAGKRDAQRPRCPYSTNSSDSESPRAAGESRRFQCAPWDSNPEPAD